MRLELTRRGSYAIRAILALANADGVEVVPARTIARDRHIPVRFLPQVLGDLSHAGLVEARLGRSGGYRLAKPAASISLLDVVEATEGDRRRQTCVLTGRVCGEATPPCDVHEVFSEAQSAMLGRLAATTVADVVERSRATEASGFRGGASSADLAVSAPPSLQTRGTSRGDEP